jgi:predicted nucleic acid-binding protein
MTFLLDVNVLMALLWENHEHHQVARPWFRQITGLRNVSSNPTRFRPHFFASRSGIQHVARSGIQCFETISADARHRFVFDDLSCADRVLRTDLMTGANQVTDHYLVALARKHGFALATFDESLAGTFSQETDLVRLIQ